MSAPDEEPRIPPVPSPSGVGAQTGQALPPARNAKGAVSGAFRVCGSRRWIKKGAERPPTFGPPASPASAWPAPVPIPAGAKRLPRWVHGICRRNRANFHLPFILAGDRDPGDLEFAHR
ncbi:hypothetical protein GCM10025759_02750 [Lysobacter panacisoli]|uniref:Uncharacterized protein n=1 Tax=Lysobacter panacisoli TaxID=1255263 RepID=A0ABP9KZ10_9GAMM